MADQSPLPTRTSHDRIFKELLERFFADFMQIFFPADAARLDFSTVTFLRQELIINLPTQTLRITDVVADVQTLTGEPETIIVHVEIEANDHKLLSKRMFDYYALLRILRQQTVLPLALVLRSGAGGLKWRTYREQLWTHELVRFRYGQVGLRDLQSDEYLRLNNPVAATLATLMKRGKASKALLKLKSLQIVVNSSLTEGDKLFLIDVVEKYLPREEVFDAQEEVMTALQEVEMTWGEKHFTEGMRTMLLLTMQRKYGQVPQSIVDKLNRITDPDVFVDLNQQLLIAPTIDALVLPAWLDLTDKEGKG